MKSLIVVVLDHRSELPFGFVSTVKFELFNAFSKRAMKSLNQSVFLGAIWLDSLMDQLMVRQQALELAGDVTAAVVASNARLVGKRSISVLR